MNWNNSIRQAHRWLSMAFTAGVLANIVTMIALEEKEEPSAWVYLTALIPLALLWFSGMYLFVLPYATNRRGERRAD